MCGYIDFNKLLFIISFIKFYKVKGFVGFFDCWIDEKGDFGCELFYLFYLKEISNVKKERKKFILKYI